jgi:hypothetical protein
MFRRRPVLTAVLLALALLPHSFDHMRRVPTINDQRITAQPLPLAGRTVGALTVAEAWEIRSANSRFGGYSSMLLSGPRQFLLLSDNAVVAQFGLSERGQVSASRLWPMALYSRLSRSKKGRDSESITRDPVTGQIWVAFEQYHRIMRFSPNRWRREAEVAPRAMHLWNGNGGAEAMVRLHDGRFLVLAETSGGPGSGTDALLFDRDPTAAPEITPLRFAYDSESKGRVTDATELPDGRVLLLHRQIDLWRGWISTIAIADPADIAARRVWRSRTLATIAEPLVGENFEAMAIEPAGDTMRIWIASDDNLAVWQRTLLLRLDWANWRRGASPVPTRNGPPSPASR